MHAFLLIDRKKSKEYQVACAKLFEAKFPNFIGEGIGIHPNKYFYSAMNALSQSTDKNKNKIKIYDN